MAACMHIHQLLCNKSIGTSTAVPVTSLKFLFTLFIISFLSPNSPAIESTDGSVSPLPDSSRHTCRTSRNACRALRSSRCRALPPPASISAQPPPPLPPPPALVRERGGEGVRGGGDWCGGGVLSRLQRRMRLDILGRFVMAPSKPTRFDHSRICARDGKGRGIIQAPPSRWYDSVQKKKKIGGVVEDFAGRVVVAKPQPFVSCNRHFRLRAGKTGRGVRSVRLTDRTAVLPLLRCDYRRLAELPSPWRGSHRQRPVLLSPHHT